MPVTLLDTAGLRDSDDRVEAIGVARSRAVAQAADVVIMVVDAGEGWQEEDTAILAALFPGRVSSAQGNAEAEGAEGGGRSPLALLVINKVDLKGRCDPGEAANGADAVAGRHGVPASCAAQFAGVVATSAVHGDGIAELGRAVLRLAGAPELAAGVGVAWAVNERQAEALTRAQEALARAVESVEADLPLDFWTIDMRCVCVPDGLEAVLKPLLQGGGGGTWGGERGRGG